MRGISQLSLTLRDARWRPLADMDGVKWALDMSSEEVESLIDEGLLVGFNIALSPSGRRELRFLTRSVELFKTTGGSRKLELSWPKIFGLITPHDKPFLKGTELDTALNCDPDHRLNLIRADLLQTVTGTGWRPGRNGGPVITRASFEHFLKGRKL